MDRERILRKLKALLSQTVANGASEQEALTAARVAADLMSKYGMTYATVEDIEAETFAKDRRAWAPGRRNGRTGKRHAVEWCLPGIDKLCGCRHFFSYDTGDLTFFGTEAETATAHYLVVVITRAIENEWKAYLKTAQPERRRSAANARRDAFKTAMSVRICRRIVDMAADKLVGGNPLVVVKNAKVDEAFEASVKTRTDKRKAAVKDQRAALAGFEAGGRTRLDTAIDSPRDDQPKLRHDK